jgi:hypothetical protein
MAFIPLLPGGSESFLSFVSAQCLQVILIHLMFGHELLLGLQCLDFDYVLELLLS